MNFDLGPDERALQAAMADLCRSRFGTERLRAEGLTREGWGALDEAGVFTLRVPESQGGVGLGMTQAVVVFEQLGRALIPGPVVATHVSRARGATEDMIAVLPRGEALLEHLDVVDVVGVIDDAGVWRVQPSEVIAEPIERPLDPLTPVHRVLGLPKGEPIAGPATAADIWIECAALTAAMLLGIAQATTDLAVEYAKERRQFDRPIGSFQAVKHLCADAYVRTEVARAAVYAAGCLLDDRDADAGARAVAGAKLLANEAALGNAKTCIQVLGGMGYTWEVDAHLYLKRAAVLAATFGSTHEHEVAMAELL